MAKGILVQCKSHNNGEPLFFWERMFKKVSSFLFQKGVFYTMVQQGNKIFVIIRHHETRNHEAVEFDPDYFKVLFKIK